MLDDTVKIGSTFETVKNTLVALGVKGTDITFLPLGICLSTKDSWQITPHHFEGQLELQDEDYIDFVAATPRALLLLAKPLEIEFPIFEYSYAPDIKNGLQLGRFLHKTFGKNAVHRFDVEMGKNQALYRYTVDLLPGTFINLKARFYIDDLEGICRVVPMATGYGHSAKGHLAAFRASIAKHFVGSLEAIEVFEGETLRRLDQFVDSLELGLALDDKLSLALTPCGDNPAVPMISRWDAEKLFGAAYNEALQSMTDWTAAKKEAVDRFESRVKEFRGDVLEGESQWWQELVARPEKLDEFNKASKEASLLKSYLPTFFYAFFERLKDWTGADNPVKNYFTPGRTSYSRLRIGPTFRELCTWLSPYVQNIWEAQKKNADSDMSVWLHYQVSHLLDESIDYGSVVPVFGRDGLRLHRPGEAPFEDRRLALEIAAVAGSDSKIGTLTGKQIAQIKHRLSMRNDFRYDNI